MKITIGIAVYNRLNLIRKMCLSLKNSFDLETCSIRVYDDCSTEFDVNVLKKEFPFITEYRRREKNLGADHNMRQMYLDFLETDDDVLVVCDSDMIFSVDWIAKIRELLPFTDGVLSCYNSALHLAFESIAINGEKLVIKETLGSTGTVFTREIVERIISNVRPSYKYDWDWCNYLLSSGIRLLVTQCSYIQHIGIVGENCDANQIVDFGLHFYPKDDDTLRLNVSLFEHLVQAKQEAVEQKNRYYYFNFRLPKYKILQWIIEPLSLFRKKLG